MTGKRSEGLRKGWLVPAVCLLVAFMLREGSAQLEELRVPQPLPSQALILGVPYISFAEAGRLEYQDKNILNPSFAASLGMILKYWGQDLSLLRRSDQAIPRGTGGWGVGKDGAAKDLDELKRFVATEIPVFVSPAITPVAHPPSPAVVAMAVVTKGFTFKEGGLYSGVLGRMISLDNFRQLEDLMKMSPWESLYLSSRAVIGYDDDRRVIILHDPSFGPAWQVSYDDFDKIWSPQKRWHLVAYSRDYANVLAKRTSAAPYRPRTPNEQAAEHFVFGYALSSVGRVVEAEERFRKGLGIAGIGKGFQHLFLFELALHYRARGNTEEAIAAAQRATELLPEHHRPWQFLAQIYRSSFIEGWQQKADEADGKAKALCTDAARQKAVVEALASHFGIFGCVSNRFLWSQ